MGYWSLLGKYISFLSMPLYILSKLTDLTYIYSKNVLSVQNPTQVPSDVGSLSNDLAGPALYFLVIDLFLYWGILALIEYGYLRAFINRFKKSEDLKRKLSLTMREEEDVYAEQKRIQLSDPTSS
jgi:hypothetical protein